MSEGKPGLPIDAFGERAPAGPRDEHGHKGFTVREALVYLCCFAAIGYTYFANQGRADQIQAERARNTASACVDTNHEHAAILGFITTSIPPSRLKDPRVAGLVTRLAHGEPLPPVRPDDPPIVAYLQRAARTFPQQNCAALVRIRVRN